MSVVLSSAVRQNLLSLSATADLLATTQSHLSTGKKVNSALDNPTNFFTAAGLDSRASDINNLLDGIGNGTQILQAANTGITSLSKLVDSAKSIANQALQTTVGYTKSTAAGSAVPGASASNLIGTTDTAATTTGGAKATLTGPTATLSSVGFANNDSFTVNGKTIKFVTGAPADAASTTDTSGNVSISLASTAGGTVQTVLDSINTITGGTASIATTQLTIANATGDKTGSIALGGSAAVLTKLGLTAGTTTATNTLISGKTLNIASTAGGTASAITFGTGAGQISTLDGLNTALATNNLQASIDTTGKLTLTTTNDVASANIGAITGTAFSGTVVNAAADATSQATRASLVSQYNQVMDQITTTAQDSSFNGVNLLNGDTLKLTFNETGTSKLSISGVSFGPGGLGLSKLTAGTDFVDNAAANKTISSLTTAATTLRSQASSFGSNLSVVQLRQDFSKSLINVLQTGSANLTLADTNEEAANSQALSTRQSIAVSALSLANTSQQGVLQLLR